MVNRKKSVIFLVSGLLGVLLLFWVFKAFFQNKPSPSATPKETKKIPSASEKREGGRLKSSYSSWGRNPFIPGSPIKTTGRLILKGIAWDEVSAFAIINNRIVREGDKIEGKKVIEIKKDSVIINDGQNNFELKL